MRLFVVIPVHNRAEDTRRCLDALRRQTVVGDIVPVVVDGGSTDGTPDMVAAGYPEAVCLRGADDLWWTGATNRGVEWALRQGTDADAVVTLNNDTSFADDYVERLRDAARRRPGAIVASLVVDERDGRVVEGGVRIDWRTARFERLARGQPAAGLAAAGLVPVDAVSGCGTLVPLAVYRRVGLYDERRLPHYAADYEFSVRAGRAGVPVCVDYAVTVATRLDTTGVHAKVGRGVRPADVVASLWSRRSANGIPQRLRFALAACPRHLLPLYVPADTLRVVAGTVRRCLREGVP